MLVLAIGALVLAAAAVVIVLDVVVGIALLVAIVRYRQVKRALPSSMVCPNCGSHRVKIGQVTDGVDLDGSRYYGD